MSLTGHLHGTLTRKFNAGGLARLGDEVAAAAGSRPVRPPRDATRGDLATVGAVVGQLIADAVEPAPPYPALLGAVRCQGLSPAGASAAAAMYPTHRQLPAGHETFAAWLRPTPAGWWLLGTPPTTGTVSAEPLVQSALERHQAAAHHFTPAQLDPRASVADQYVLSLLESVYRGGSVAELQHLAAAGKPAVAESVTEDVQRTAAAARRPLQRLRTLATGAPEAGRLGYAAPTLVPQWAEGDLAIGPDQRDGGFTLLDVKTSLRAHRPEQAQQWVAQLVAYALLDVADRWRIRRLGLLLPRQGVLVGWQRDELLAQVSMGTPSQRGSWISEATRAARADSVDQAELDELGLG